MKDLQEIIKILKMGYGTHANVARALGIHKNHYSMVCLGKVVPSTLLYNSMVIHAKVVKEDIKKMCEK